MIKASLTNKKDGFLFIWGHVSVIKNSKSFKRQLWRFFIQSKTINCKENKHSKQEQDHFLANEDNSNIRLETECKTILKGIALFGTDC
ncbi:hypothetical protein CHH77_03735 [Shouchella clausii]|uniref:Uncharacterized protein n=1 Tax=Shouchella clausii TaxID=79880 RepID=A0A268P4K4_SHOCL|nr:hypothetical protein WZ76_14310 [Shouchella clausii]PAD18140.1 hypothetical protein CHH73_07510 [Shouchella clausii]PAD48618.1 hypothetical protein CHI09_01225 [Shouchella clausii]PAE84583.1 hypothetical protein CHH77_03735 [Shouchella clausii]PAE90657.1 hypothetical protein CHH72_01900 [Shouchella clausii]